MREIKFNFYDTDFDQMLTEDDYSQDDLGKILSDNERFIPLQYTGLKDKNGVEIYGGDIVKSDKGTHQVNHYLSQFELDRLPKVFLRSDNNLLLSEWYDQCEVIGNIYEHSHLLEGESNEIRTR